MKKNRRIGINHVAEFLFFFRSLAKKEKRTLLFSSLLARFSIPLSPTRTSIPIHSTQSATQCTEKCSKTRPNSPNPKNNKKKQASLASTSSSSASAVRRAPKPCCGQPRASSARRQQLRETNRVVVARAEEETKDVEVSFLSWFDSKLLRKRSVSFFFFFRHACEFFFLFFVSFFLLFFPSSSSSSSASRSLEKNHRKK